MSDLDYIARQNAELQQRVDGLEQTIERRVRGNLERVFADRLDNAMRGKDAELTFLKTKVKMFETELGRRGDSGFTPDYRKAQLLGGRSLANFDVRETIQNVKGAVQNFSFASYVTYIAMAQLFLCYLTNIARFDLFCAVVIVAIYATHEMDRLAMAAYLGFMVFSIIMDIVWMSQHSDTSMFAVTATFEGTMQFILILFPAISTFRTLPLVKPSEQRGNRPPLSPFVRVLDGLFVLQLAFCFFNSLARADLYAVVIMIGLYAVHENDKFAMKAYYFFTAVTVVVDIIYLGLHGSEEYNNIRQNNLASTEPKSFVYGTTICNLLIKIIFAFVTMKLFREMPDRKPSESQPSMEAMPGSGFSRITHIALGSNERATIVMLALQFVFVLFESLARLDVFSVVLVIGMYAVNEKDKVALESYFVASFLPSFIMDIVWLAEHQDAAKFAWQAGSSATVTFAMILVVLNMILKLGILIPAIRFHTELPDVKPSEQHTQMGRERVMGMMSKFTSLPELEKWRRVMLGFAIVHLVLFFFECLDRFDPFCIVIPILFYAVNERDRNALLAYLLFMDLSFILDIVWLSMHGDDLKTMALAASKGQWSPVKPSIQFTFAMAIISIFVKFVAHIPAILLLRALPNVKPSEEGSSLDPGMSAPIPIVDAAIPSGRRTPGAIPAPYVPPPAPAPAPAPYQAPLAPALSAGRYDPVPAPVSYAPAMAPPAPYEPASTYNTYSSVSRDMPTFGSAAPAPAASNVYSGSGIVSMNDLEAALREREKRLAESGY
eukprot:tig00001095_g7047.t1